MAPRMNIENQTSNTKSQAIAYPRIYEKHSKQSRTTGSARNECILLQVTCAGNGQSHVQTPSDMFTHTMRYNYKHWAISISHIMTTIDTHNDTHNDYEWHTMITLDIFLAVGRSQVCTFSSWTIRSLATHVNAAKSFLRGNCWREHLRQSHRIQSFRWAHPKSCRWGMPDMSRQLSRCFFFLAAWHWTLWVCSRTCQGGTSLIGLIVLHHTTASVVPALIWLGPAHHANHIVAASQRNGKTDTILVQYDSSNITECRTCEELKSGMPSPVQCYQWWSANARSQVRTAHARSRMSKSTPHPQPEGRISWLKEMRWG